MSIMDAELLLCESQSIAATAGGSTTSTNVIYIPQVNDHTDTASNDRPNVSDRLHLNVVVEDEDLLAAVDGSVVTIALYNDTDAVPTTGGDVIITKDITVNTPAVNYVDGTQIMSTPLPSTLLKPYFGLLSSVATQDLSTGKITAWIGTPIQQGGEHGAL